MLHCLLTFTPCQFFTSAAHTHVFAGSNGTRALHDKLMEVKTLHSIASEQFNKLFTMCNIGTGGIDKTEQDIPKDVLRKELLLCKSSAGGVVDSLDGFLDLVQRREETWKKRMAKVNDKRKRLETLYKVVQRGAILLNVVALVAGSVLCGSGPDWRLCP